MQRYALLGLSHKSAPLEIRERLAFNGNALAMGLRAASRDFGFKQCIILSTCNRVEILVFCDAADSRARLMKFLADFHHVSEDFFDEFAYYRVGGEAIEHIYQLASSLDSLVLGENQILAQLKSAYSQAVEEGTTGKAINALLHNAFRVAKSVHATTEISRGQLSIASTAVGFIRRTFTDMTRKTAMIVGTGEMAQITLRHLVDAGIGKVIVANRTLENAEAMVEAFDAQAIPLDLLPDYLSHSDIVVSQTAAPGHVISREDVAKAMKKRRGRPFFLVDLAVPRDIHPGVDTIPDVYRYEVDDLQKVVGEVSGARAAEVERCKSLIREEVANFVRNFRTFAVEPMIDSVRSRGDDVMQAELDRLDSRLKDLSEEARQEVRESARRMINKLIHGPIQVIKDEARGEGADARLLQLIERMFNPVAKCPVRHKDAKIDLQPSRSEASSASEQEGSKLAAELPSDDASDKASLSPNAEA